MGICSSKDHKMETMIQEKKVDFTYSTEFRSSDSPVFYKLDKDEWYVRSNLQKYHTYLDFTKNDLKLKWELAECTVDDVRAYHPESRIIFQCKNKIKILSPLLNSLLKMTNRQIDGVFSFLKYEKGCFTLKHTDRIGDYTCLIFPAGYKSTGGELVIYKDGKEIVNFKHYNIEYDTIVIFPVGLEHEVLPVTSGERYVFKCSLSNIVKPEITYVTRCCDGIKD